jgi:hypothetical protein
VELVSPDRTVKALMVQATPEKVEMAQVSRAAPTEMVTAPLVEEMLQEAEGEKRLVAQPA